MGVVIYPAQAEYSVTRALYSSPQVILPLKLQLPLTTYLLLL